MLDIKRRKNESFESFYRRFTRRVQESGRILQAKKIRFHLRKKNKSAARKSALRRLEISVKRDYLLKTGRLVEEEGRRPTGGNRP
ncbi:MAG TPA: 30S ribosomal protein S21 [Patescibacteria group bacterium]|nr:30S ribosomal protein S21 [Patescibacteria group bacterium]